MICILIDGVGRNLEYKIQSYIFILDRARAIEKYDKEEAKALLSFLEWGIDEYNTPFVKAANSDGGYFFEYEEVPCATKYNEETDKAEYKEGYHNYFCIRFVR